METFPMCRVFVVLFVELYERRWCRSIHILNNLRWNTMPQIYRNRSLKTQLINQCYHCTYQRPSVGGEGGGGDPRAFAQQCLQLTPPRNNIQRSTVQLNHRFMNVKHHASCVFCNVTSKI